MPCSVGSVDGEGNRVALFPRMEEREDDIMKREVRVSIELLMVTLSRVSSQGHRALLTPPDLACGTGKYTHFLSTLGASAVTGYDISPTMISSAQALYPSSTHSALHFSVLDCSLLSSLPLSEKGYYDLVFSAWFLNYAGTERELTNMFAFIEAAMVEGGQFVGLTTDAHDADMSVPKHDFYGLDVEVLEPDYIAPDTGEVVGIKAKVRVGSGGFEFDCYQFRADVYERCARRAGLEVRWRDCVVPDDQRRETRYWDEWLRRPTFAMLEARRVGEWGSVEC